MHQFDQEISQRQENSASGQVDQRVERRDPDRACLCLEKRNSHYRIDQVEDH